MLLGLFIAGGCDKSADKPKTKKETPKNVTYPKIAGDAMYQLVKEQVEIGPRYPNSEGHKVIQQWILDQLRETSASVIEQDFTAEAYDGTLLKGKNIMAQLYPEKRKRILLATHYDTRPYADQDTENPREPILGANDGGSGTAVLLQLVKTLSSGPDTPDVGVDFLFLDLEDYGQPSFYEEGYKDRYGGYCLGSRHWAENRVPENYRGYFGILLDMVGAKGATFTQEGNSRSFAPKVLKKVWAAAQQVGASSYFQYTQTDPITDDHIFLNQGGTPTIDVIHYDPVNRDPFFRHWHKHSDDLSNIDPKTLEAVGNTLSYVLFSE